MEKDLIEWLERISKPKDELGGFSVCPFAKKALEDKKVFWSYIGPEAESYILRYIEATPEFEVIAFFNLKCDLTFDDLYRIVQSLQSKRKDMIFLPDHPLNPGYIKSIETGNQRYPCILVQTRKSLEEARLKLKRTNYYDYWDEDYKKEIWGYGNES